MSKAQKILEYLNQTPRLSDKEIAHRMNCTTDYVRKLCRRMAHVDNEVKEDTNALLDTRATTYGTFISGADTAMRLKSVIQAAVFSNTSLVQPDALLALDMIAVKISRIVNGDPDYVDNWTDIAGYATLVADRIKGNIR